VKVAVAVWVSLLLVCTVTGCGGAFHANSNIAFMGDSITNYWSLPATNFGVPGNTTTNMLDRFSGEVLGHGYKAVVILGGSNDIRNVNTSVDEEVATVVANLQAMAEDARKDNFVVVLCDLPPIANDDARVVPLNAAITSLAKANKYRLVDYYTPMAGHPEYFKDGLHPNDSGYAVMAAALSEVLPLDY